MRKKILIIEDNELWRELLKESLESNGHETLTAADGQEGIMLLKKYSDFDLVITDFQMPKANGIEIIKFIRQPDPDHNTKIILLSADDMRLVYPAAKNAGADRVIAKDFSFSLNAISRAIRELFNVRH